MDEPLINPSADFMPSPSMVLGLADLAPVKIMFVATDGTIEYVNETYAHWLGVPRSDIVGKHILNGLIMTDSAEFSPDKRMERIKRVAESRGEEEFKTQVKHPDGSLRTVLVRLKGHEEGLGVYALFRDITAEENLEAEVQRRGRALDRIFNLSGEVLAILNYDGVFESASPSAERLTGVSVETVIREGIHFTKFIHPDDLSRVTSAFQEAVGGTPLVSFEFRVCHSDGSVRWTSWSAQPVPEDRVLLLIGRDITEERYQQEKFRQTQKMEAIGQLTGGIAHDFNNLLAAISGSVDLMEKRLGQGRVEQLPRYLDACRKASSRAAQLTQRLLAFARRQPLAPVPVDANDLITSIEDMLGRSIGPSVQVKDDLETGLWPTICDPNQLESSILNCAINARDAMPKGGEITLSTRNIAEGECHRHDVPLGEWVMVGITDTGAGMPKQVLDRAFDPFFTTKPIGQGTGLGLSMLYGFVSQSEGHVRLASELGKGTTVEMFLPRYTGQISPLPVEADEPHVMPILARAGETILIVEDEELVRDLLVEVMTNCGYQVIQAEDATVALPVIESGQRIDLLLSDVGLPGMNGRQLAEVARGVRPDLKVLFLTGFAPNATLRHQFLSDGMDLMTKPFDVDAVATRVADMIGSGPKEAAA